MADFKILNETVERNPELEAKIRDRLINGFSNWNGGYDCWLEWCNTLYQPDAHYNLQMMGDFRRLTLQQYKDLMGEFFKHFTMDLLDFDNMLVIGNWCAIRYKTKCTNLATGAVDITPTMEFVKFSDDGEYGARVIEGWAISAKALG